MPISPADIAQPIDWKDAKFGTMLDELQANILTGHGRHSIRMLFLTVKPRLAARAKATMKTLAPSVTTAKQQLNDIEIFKQTGTPGGAVLLAFITSAGYVALGTVPTKRPEDEAFAVGMAKRQAILADPPAASWEAPLAKPAHAMILIADASQALCTAKQADVMATLGAAWALAHVQTGQGIFDDAGEGLEHFGYVDGRSQPLMLADRVAGELQASGGSFNWDPSFGPRIALVTDKCGTKGSDSVGSYLVFRKLEQDVAGFKAAEASLADAQARAAKKAGINPLPDRELAGAMMVGRFEDGTPVIGSATPGVGPDNNFNYNGDPDGNRCPLHAHVRKTNPRQGFEKGSIMPRRGITYGGLEGSGADVGLLFMAYNQNISAQFEFIQQSWANNPSFLETGTGIDPIIGQSSGRRPSYPNCPVAHGSEENHVGDFQQFVTMRGGDYFFAPSISGLANL